MVLDYGPPKVSHLTYLRDSRFCVGKSIWLSRGQGISVSCRAPDEQWEKTTKSLGICGKPCRTIWRHEASCLFGAYRETLIAESSVFCLCP